MFTVLASMDLRGLVNTRLVDHRSGHRIFHKKNFVNCLLRFIRYILQLLCIVTEESNTGLFHNLLFHVELRSGRVTKLRDRSAEPQPVRRFLHPDGVKALTGRETTPFPPPPPILVGRNTRVEATTILHFNDSAAASGNVGRNDPYSAENASARLSCCCGLGW